MRAALAALLLGVLAACKPALPEQARPALWEVTGPAGQQGWLFGTVHALAEPVAWDTPAVMRAFNASDRLVVEIAGLRDPKAIAATFAALAASPGLPPLDQRLPELQRPALAEVLLRSRMSAAQFGGIETWAAALTLARAASPEQDASFGIDRALLERAQGKPVEELEGAEAQLRIFDALPEADQRDLLVATVVEATGPDRSADLARAWASGNMAVIAAETQRGLLADPELRAALLVGRNRAWTERVDSLVRSGARPFVAVGAAHLAGPDGLPDLLTARGYTVRRIQ